MTKQEEQLAREQLQHNYPDLPVDVELQPVEHQSGALIVTTANPKRDNYATAIITPEHR